MTDGELFEIADSQQGYFTAQQAVQCGIRRANFHHRINKGEWLREWRGIYRLVHYPITERPELALWSLWSCNLSGVPQGVWSYETALDIHDLSDIMPNEMHMTVPKTFRRRSEIPRVIRLHFEELKPDEIEQRHGYRVTTPLKTLKDVVSSQTVAGEFILQALEQALERGLVSRRELMEATPSPPIVKLREFIQ